MSLGKLKTSISRRNVEWSNVGSTKDLSSSNYANGDVDRHHDNDYALASNGSTTQETNVKTYPRQSNRLNGGIFKSLRRKLPWNSVRDCGERGGGGGGCVSVEDDPKLFANSNSSGLKQGKTSKNRAICPMPSPIRALRRLGGSKDVERQDGRSRESKSLGSVVSSSSETSSVGNEDSMPHRTVIVRRQSTGTTSPTLRSGEDEESLVPCPFPRTTIATSVPAVDNDYILAQYDIQVPKTTTRESQGGGSRLTMELFRLSKYGWYWGPISRSEAEEKLLDQTDGAFLVRDSSDDRYLLSLSFRSFGKTLHTRIEHCNGMFSFYAQPESEGHSSIVELIEHSMSYSQSGVFCYSRARTPGAPSYPVRLTKPISRFTQVRSLQYLCRFVIRQSTRLDLIQELPLPTRIRGYIQEGHY